MAGYMFFLLLFFSTIFDLSPFTTLLAQCWCGRCCFSQRSPTEVQMAVIPGYVRKERKGDNMSTCTLHGKLSRMIVCVECP